MSKMVDLINKKFNSLTVLRIDASLVKKEVTMWFAIKTFFLMVFGNPVTKAVVAVAVKDITEAGVNVLRASASAVAEAATMDCKGVDKLDYVVDKLKDEVVDLPKAMLTNVVTSVYRSLNEEGKV